MLVLTRKVDEKIRLDGPGTISVLKIGGSNVRLGIEADPRVNIVRDELAPLTSEELVLINAVLERKEELYAHAETLSQVSIPRA